EARSAGTLRARARQSSAPGSRHDCLRMSRSRESARAGAAFLALSRLSQSGSTPIHYLAPPQLDHHQHQHAVANIVVPRLMLLDQRSDGVRVEEAPAPNAGRAQQVVNELPELMAQPTAERNIETVLGAVDDVSRKS